MSSLYLTQRREIQAEVTLARTSPSVGQEVLFPQLGRVDSMAYGEPRSNLPSSGSKDNLSASQRRWIRLSALYRHS